LSDAPPENGCRPAVDVLFRSAAAACGDRALALVLTGMGQDGARGALALRRAGGRVLVQDQESSVVWGMPGTTVEMGAADEVLSLCQMGDTVRRHLGMGD
jgi:two-component system chemotaxis response regulator CheB